MRMLTLFLHVGLYCLKQNDANQDKEKHRGARETLKYIESIQKLGRNCTPGFGYKFDLKFDHSKWYKQGSLAVLTANFFTKLLFPENKVPSYITDDFIFSLLRCNLESDEFVYGAALAFEKYVYKDYEQFDPYVFRNGSVIMGHDISVNYKYLDSNDSDWFYGLKYKKNLNLTWNDVYIKPRYNSTGNDHGPQVHFTEPRLTFVDGYWTSPYYDCAGAFNWMVTFTSAILCSDSNKNAIFCGLSSIDINLSNLDINQCDVDNQTDQTDFDVFRGSHLCQETTQCHPIPGLGFRRGSYQCVCLPGYYFPYLLSPEEAFSGLMIEEAFESQNKSDHRIILKEFQCISCSEGCDICVDDTPCMAQPNKIFRAVIMLLILVATIESIVFLILLRKYSDHQVIKSASPLFLYIMCTGMFFMTLEGFFAYPTIQSDLFCLCRIWFKAIGFFTCYGAILLKTWRISQIFHVRSAKVINITDNMLLRKLLLFIILPVSVYLVIWTILERASPVAEVDNQGLKYHRCRHTTWRLISLIGQCLFLLWGVYLCFRVRKAPSNFNESRFISLAIYNSICMSAFLFIIRVTVAMNYGQNVIYLLGMIDLHIHVTFTGLLIILPKMYLAFSGKGNNISRTKDISQISASREAQVNPNLNKEKYLKILEKLRHLEICDGCSKKINAILEKECEISD